MACNCEELNAANTEPGTIIMCDACLAGEIRRLDRYYNDGRTGYVCDRCGAASWEPEVGPTCADCLEKTP